MTAVSIGHVSFSNVNKQTMAKNSYEKTFSNIIGIAKYSSLKKVIVIAGYVLRFINNLKSSIKKKGLCKEDILQVNENNESLKLWIKCEQRLLAILTGKAMFYSIQCKNGCLTAFDLFICLHNQLNSIYFIITF